MSGLMRPWPENYPGPHSRGELTGAEISDVHAVPRERLQEIFEKYGFAVYSSETTESLTEALRVNIKDGTIPIGDLYEET